jgi:protein-disulfide isomerase
MKDEHEIVRLARPVDESDHVLGPQAAVATLVEYGDYECPYCRRLHPMLKEMMGRIEGLRFIYRHFPLRNIHPYSVRAAEAAEAASAQGRFWEMHDLLFEQDLPLDDERLSRLARKTGLQMERYAKEMADNIYSGRVEENFKSALYEDGVTGTPSLYLNGVRLSDMRSLEELLHKVTEAGATLQPASRERAGWLTRLRRFRPGMTRLRLI